MFPTPQVNDSRGWSAQHDALREIGVFSHDRPIAMWFIASHATKLRVRGTIAQIAGARNRPINGEKEHAANSRRWTDAYLAAFATAGGLTVLTLVEGFRSFAGVQAIIWQEQAKQAEAEHE
jgi:hypothetical protein